MIAPVTNRCVQWDGIKFDDSLIGNLIIKHLWCDHDGLIRLYIYTYVYIYKLVYYVWFFFMCAFNIRCDLFTFTTSNFL